MTVTVVNSIRLRTTADRIRPAAATPDCLGGGQRDYFV
jgi:hypothetical protein